MKFYFFSNSITKYNHFILISFYKKLINYFIFFKNDVFFNSFFLIDVTSVDKKFLKFLNFYKSQKDNIIYILYFFNLKTTISLINFNYYFDSLNNILNNSKWLEREVSEMFNINIFNSSDNRKLLLDYSKIEYPMLKNFPSEGYKDVFFNFFENQVFFLNNEVVEL